MSSWDKVVSECTINKIPFRCFQEDRATPMGTGPNAGDCLSLFLVFGDSTVRSTVKVYVEFTFRILDQVRAMHESS